MFKMVARAGRREEKMTTKPKKNSQLVRAKAQYA